MIEKEEEEEGRVNDGLEDGKRKRKKRKGGPREERMTS